MIKYIMAVTVICLSTLMWMPVPQEGVKSLPQFETIGLTGQVVTQDIFKHGGAALLSLYLWLLFIRNA